VRSITRLPFSHSVVGSRHGITQTYGTQTSLVTGIQSHYLGFKRVEGGRQAAILFQIKTYFIHNYQKLPQSYAKRTQCKQGTRNTPQFMRYVYATESRYTIMQTENQRHIQLPRINVFVFILLCLIVVTNWMLKKKFRQ
jgi:hypothetical protein